MASQQGVKVVHRDLDASQENPGAEIAAIIANLKETDPRNLTPIWKDIGDVLEPLFSTPPSPGAQVLISFPDVHRSQFPSKAVLLTHRVSYLGALGAGS